MDRCSWERCFSMPWHCAVEFPPPTLATFCPQLTPGFRSLLDSQMESFKQEEQGRDQRWNIPQNRPKLEPFPSILNLLQGLSTLVNRHNKALKTRHSSFKTSSTHISSSNISRGGASHQVWGGLVAVRRKQCFLRPLKAALP